MEVYKLVLFLILTFLTTNAYSSNLCDEQCTLVIDFPSGGSIEANSPVVITFGDSGLVQTPVTSTAYLAGETISLNAGESIIFFDGGHFDIGDAGNIDYTNLTITTDGTIDLSATGGSESLNIPPTGGQLSLIAGEFSVRAPVINIFGSLNIATSTTLEFAREGVSSECSITNSSDSNLTIGSSSSLIIENTDNCSTIIDAVRISTDSNEIIFHIDDQIVSNGSFDINQVVESEQPNSGSFDEKFLFVLGIFFIIRIIIKKHNK